MGSSANEQEIQRLFEEGQRWIRAQSGQVSFDFLNEEQLFSSFISGIEQVSIAGTDLLLGKIFDEIGFDQIEDELFRQLVVSRLCFPASKLKTTDYLQKYHGVSIHPDQIYRYLDKLYNGQKELVQQISYQHTLKILNNQISVVFYDVTTLYLYPSAHPIFQDSD